MEIKYLEKLKNAPKIREQKTKGVSESEILKIEKKFNIKFPQAYKEFLFLAGKDHGGLNLADGATSLEELSDDNYRTYLQDAISDGYITIDRPFWVISEQDGYEQFYFFYLDEDNENPNVYGVTHGSGDNSEVYSLNETFSEFISTVIDKSIYFDKLGS